MAGVPGGNGGGSFTKYTREQRVENLRKGLAIQRARREQAKETAAALAQYTPNPDGKTMYELRALFLAEAYALLRTPAVWQRLMQLLLADDSKVALKGFELIFGGLVQGTKPEADGARGPMQVVIQNNIARPVVAGVDTRQADYTSTAAVEVVVP